jgi:hypothetical protein
MKNQRFAAAKILKNPHSVIPSFSLSLPPQNFVSFIIKKRITNEENTWPFCVPDAGPGWSQCPNISGG